MDFGLWTGAFLSRHVTRHMTSWRGPPGSRQETIMRGCGRRAAGNKPSLQYVISQNERLSIQLVPTQSELVYMVNSVNPAFVCKSRFYQAVRPKLGAVYVVPGVRMDPISEIERRGVRLVKPAPHIVTHITMEHEIS